MNTIMLTLKTRNNEGFRNYFSRNEAKKDITKYLRLLAEISFRSFQLD